MPNATTLADEYAIAKAEADAATKRAAELRKQILATGRAELIGATFTVAVQLSERKSFSADLAKQFLTPEQVERCTVASIVETLRVRATTPSR